MLCCKNMCLIYEYQLNKHRLIDSILFQLVIGVEFPSVNGTWFINLHLFNVFTAFIIRFFILTTN